MSRRLLAIAALAAAAPLVALGMSHQPADDRPAGHARHGAAHAEPGDAPSTQAYREAARQMHAAMDLPMSGNADVDFARGMIGHHEGAIDMAQIVLEYGSDPELRQLAEEIIAAQEREVEFLKDWLARRGE
jgi:uncharacterized protein (DUF305 family)